MDHDDGRRQHGVLSRPDLANVTHVDVQVQEENVLIHAKFTQEILFIPSTRGFDVERTQTVFIDMKTLGPAT